MVEGHSSLVTHTTASALWLGTGSLNSPTSAAIGQEHPLNQRLKG